MLTGNKGEWSEIYALLKIVADQCLYAGDANLTRIESLIYPVIKVLRNESGGSYEYSYDSHLVIIKNNTEEFRIPISEFHKQASHLLLSIRNATGSSFSIPETETFINSFNCKSLKANSRVKSDINIVIHDLMTGTHPQLGFSIKSQLGGASTLLNAGRTTNFVYQIQNSSLDENAIAEINRIDSRSKIKDRLAAIDTHQGVLVFKRTENIIFGNNLVLIDSCLPAILAQMLILYYKSNLSMMADLVDELSKINPLGFDFSNSHPFYTYKIKRFLTDVALGMMPSKVWKGELDATGGNLVVKEDGEILCYHIYNRNEFEEYLLNNTKLDTASSSRHEFGSIYEDSFGLFLT